MPHTIKTENSNNFKKTFKKRGLMPAFDKNAVEVYLGKHWSGSDMPLLQTDKTAGKYPNATLSTPIVPVKFSNLGPNGSIGTCNGLIQRENATFDVVETVIIFGSKFSSTVLYLDFILL